MNKIENLRPKSSMKACTNIRDSLSSKNKIIWSKGNFDVLMCFFSFVQNTFEQKWWGHYLNTIYILSIFLCLIYFQFDFRVQESMAENQTIWSMIKEMINIELMIKPLFLMIIISSFLGMLGFFVPIIFLTDMATLKGIQYSQATFLISIYGEWVLHCCVKCL